MDVIGIGLANIDLVAHISDAFLTSHKVTKGRAHKMDDLSFARLRSDLEQFDAIPGGCSANVVCGLATMGVSTQFLGKIGDDSFEGLWRSSFHDFGVAYDVTADTKESSQCAVLVTPDGERSFAYMDGASWNLSSKDIDVKSLASARMVVSEIYMFGFGQDAEVARCVFESVQTNKTPHIMKIMDQDFGHQYAQKIHALVDAGIITTLIGNHFNMPYLFGTQDIPSTIEALKTLKCESVLTHNRDGAYHIQGGEVFHQPVTPVEKPKNTTGAGDQFMAGFIMGKMDGKSIPECMEFASNCARVILMHDTARPPLVNRHSIRF
jgi:sugar/nucleoside kinase (ribokinase family)